MDSNDDKLASKCSEPKLFAHSERKTQNKSASSVVRVDSSSATNRNNENQQNSRVIKQIFTLDAKKLKSLGIESNILSAITKLNGKKGVAGTAAVTTAATAANKPEKIATPSPAPPPAIDSINRKSSETAREPLSVSPMKKLPTTSDTKSVNALSVADKKVHVLSNVVLNELDLDHLSATVITNPVKSAEDILIGAQASSQSALRPSTSRVELSLRAIERTQSHESSNDATLGENEANEESSDSFAGFYPSMEESARNQLRELNALQLRTPSKQTTTVECNGVLPTRIDDAPNAIDESSSESESSEAVSDPSMDELIYTAQMAIENDNQNKSVAEEASKASDDAKNAVEQLTEQTDKDKLIDEFLCSIKTSFRVYDPVDEDEDSQRNEGIERPPMSNSNSSSAESEDEMYTKLINKDVYAKEFLRSCSATVETVGSDVEVEIGTLVTVESQDETEIDMREIDEPIESAAPAPITGMSIPSNDFLPTEEKSPIMKITQIIPENKTINAATSTEPVTKATPSDASMKIVEKKRRGRKPKHRQLVDDTLMVESDEVDATSTDTKAELNETSISTSRSGRRRKQRVIEDFFYAPKAIQITAEPPHDPLGEKNVEIKKEAPDSDHVESTISVIGRRGRKRKMEDAEVSDATSVEITTETVETRRRGRPKRNAIPASMVTSTPIAASQDLRQMKLSSSVELELPKKPTDEANELPEKRRRGRKKAAASQDDDNSVAVEPETAPTEPKRGRGKTPKIIIKIEQTQTIAAVAATKSVTCGNCREDVPTQTWKKHLSSHYGLGWREGIDACLDLNDDALITRVMTQFLKKNKISYLVCAKCGEKKKSSVGYISHMQVCGLSAEELANARVKCEHCGKTYRKVSLPSHIQSFCPVLRLQKQQEEAALRATVKQDRVNEDEMATEKESKRGTSRFGRKKKKRVFYDGSASSKPTRIDGFVKKNRITGGTFIGWKRALRESNIIRCPTENCTFTTESTEAMHLHYKTCAPRYRCAFCKYFGVERDVVVEHIRTVHVDEMRVLNGHGKKRGSDDENGSGHDDNDDDDDFHATGDESSSSDGYSASGDESSDLSGADETDSDCSNRVFRIKAKKSKKVTSLPYHMETFAPKLWRMLRSHYQEILYLGDKYYPNAMAWTSQFVAENYNRNALAIADGGGSVQVLRDSRKYLHSLHPQSVPFRNATSGTYALSIDQPLDVDEGVENALQRIPLFESSCDAINSKLCVLFCGGPIVAFEWVPFPVDYAGPQVLVVCSRRPNGKHTALRAKQEKSEYLIQVWRVTMRTKTEVERCEFAYGIACDDGPILCFKLCPSDAFADGSQLALLAVPSYNGNINILSLPFDVQGAKRPRIITVKPKIVLQLDEAPETVSQLTWSREHGHTTICAGYTSGMVAIWNLCNLNSTYLCRRHEDGTRSLRPQRVFQPTQKCVTMLELHADHTSVPRWLLVGGLDRTVYFYDLNDPFAIKISTTSFRSRLIAGTWPMHWPNYIALYDCAMGFSGASLSIKFVHEIFNLGPTRSHSFEGTPSNIAFNDWLNCCIYGNDSGDLFFVRFQQLLLHDRLDSSSDMKVIGQTDVVGSESQRSIVFNDIAPSVDVTDCEKFRQPPVDEMLPSKVNRIAFNANEAHHQLYAVGYESGFCRISSLS